MDSKYVDDLIDKDEIPELTDADLASMVPFAQLPADLQHTLREIQQGKAAIRPDKEHLRARSIAVGR
jgi:hypothetical protein